MKKWIIIVGCLLAIFGCKPEVEVDASDVEQFLFLMQDRNHIGDGMGREIKMGTDLILKKGAEEINLGRAYRWAIDENNLKEYEHQAIKELFILAAYVPKSLEEVYDWKRGIEYRCEELVRIGQIKFLELFKENGWEAVKE